MRVKITAHFGNYAHANLTPPLIVDVDEKDAREWSKNGWCVILPEEKSDEPKAKDAPIETATIRQPETATGVRQRSDRMPKPPSE